MSTLVGHKNTRDVRNDCEQTVTSQLLHEVVACRSVTISDQEYLWKKAKNIFKVNIIKSAAFVVLYSQIKMGKYRGRNSKRVTSPMMAKTTTSRNK